MAEEHAAAQEEERLSLAAIFADDFSSLDDDSHSYSIRLRPELGDAREGSGDEACNLALAVAYSPTYPDVAPIISLVCGEGRTLHDVQERALLRAVMTAAEADLGMPSVYTCIMAAHEFLEKGGLAQAGLALLSDDCLAQILSYLAASREDVEGACTALPIFEAASQTNVVWRQLCRMRWSAKWGFARRWERALAKSTEEGFDPQFWRKAYEEAERDAERRAVSLDELVDMTFDCRQWFSWRAFRNQPDNMRDVLPTGLKEFLASDVHFRRNGDIACETERRWLGQLTWRPGSSNDESISEVTLARNRSSVECLAVQRLPNWGWELRGSDYVFRALDVDGDTIGPWEDLTSNIILEERPEWVTPQRGPYPYNYREIPDCKLMLDW